MRRVRRLSRLGPMVVLAALALAALLCSPAVASPSPASVSISGDSLRFDPAVRTGTLPNGLRYFIRANQVPPGRVSLALAVAVGSNSETDDQRGFAHFCEHLNFDGSAHFAPQELVAYLRSVGMSFGSDVSAHTGYDETVYDLDVPTDRDTLLDRSLGVLSDFAGGATMSDAQIEKERGVLIEEWRFRRGAVQRIQSEQMRALCRGSRYAERESAGLPQIIQKAPAASLRDFYHTWYRPDLMAVIAVGDIDPARMEGLIRARFGGLGASVAPSTTQVPDIPLERETRMVAVDDPEATQSTVTVYYEHARHASRTVADARHAMLASLYITMLDERLTAIAGRPDPPFLQARAASAALGSGLDTLSLRALVPDGGIARGLTALVEEGGRARRDGFAASELQRVKDERRRRNERAFAERGSRTSDELAARYVRAFVTGEVVPGTEVTHALTEALLDGITLEEVNALGAQLLSDDHRVVFVSGPRKAGAPLPDEAQLRVLLAKAAALPAAAPAVPESRAPGRGLMPELPVPGAVSSRRAIAPLGVTVLTFSNGLEAWLKPTDFKADEILIGGYAKGGLSVADSAAFPTASFATSLVEGSGFGGLSRSGLQSALEGRTASIEPFAGTYEHGVRGLASPADLETALQLVHLEFTQPTGDPGDLENCRLALSVKLADVAKDPERALYDTAAVVNSGGFYMNRRLTAEDLGTVMPGAALDVYRKRYANAADFTFFLVGAFQVDSITPLLARYLGSLPSTGRRAAAFAPRGPRFPSGVQTVRVRNGMDPKSETIITFFVNDGLEAFDLHRAQDCAAILSDHVRQSLRETSGAMYSASASFWNSKPLPGYATMTVAFSCDPARVDALVAAALAEVRELRDVGPSLADVQKVQEIDRRKLEELVRRNDYWLGRLYSYHELGWDPLRILDGREHIERCTPENLRATFVKYCPLDHYTVITRLPE